MRAELALVAFDLFRRKGFDKVTIDDVAEAAGVSRSTFLRYFGTKEDAVLSAFESKSERVAAALRARPADEDDWTALRHAMDHAIASYADAPDEALAVARLVRGTPALRARQLEKMHAWRPALAQALAERAGTGTPSVAHWVRASAALDCFSVGVDHWVDSDGGLDLIELLDEAFAALAPR
ncbi:TetR family transcriptional regulator [Lentzea nigeriaca]